MFVYNQTCIYNTHANFFLISLLKECDATPKVNNSDEDFAIVSRNERDGVFLNGTSVEYNCSEDHVTSVSTSTCNVDGEWIPEVKCYPGGVHLKVDRVILFYDFFCCKNVSSIL